MTKYDPQKHHRRSVRLKNYDYSSAGAYAVTNYWQRNYYEHIIRNDKDLQNKTDYINANPLLWDQDDENLMNADSS